MTDAPVTMVKTRSDKQERSDGDCGAQVRRQLRPTLTSPNYNHIRTTGYLYTYSRYLSSLVRKAMSPDIDPSDAGVEHTGETVTKLSGTCHVL